MRGYRCRRRFRTRGSIRAERLPTSLAAMCANILVYNARELQQDCVDNSIQDAKTVWQAKDP